VNSDTLETSVYSNTGSEWNLTCLVNLNSDLISIGVVISYTSQYIYWKKWKAKGDLNCGVAAFLGVHEARSGCIWYSYWSSASYKCHHIVYGCNSVYIILTVVVSVKALRVPRFECGVLVSSGFTERLQLDQYSQLWLVSW